MEYGYLKAFLLVADTKSFTEAALRLRIAQSAVSRQIRLLEQGLHTQLFVRSKKSVILTPAGQRLVERFKPLDQWIDTEFNSGIPEVRVGALQGALLNWLLERLCAYDPANMPNFTLSAMSDEAIADALESGKIDVGLTAHRLERDHITSRKVFSQEFCLISKEKVDLARIHECRWISSPRASYLGRLSKKKPQRFIHVDSVEAMIQLVEAGFGVAVLPVSLIDKSRKLHVNRAIPVPGGAIYLAMPNYKILPKHLSDFLKALS